MLAFSAFAGVCCTAVRADEAGDARQQIDTLKQQVNDLMKRIEELSAKQEAAAAKEEQREKEAREKGPSKTEEFLKKFTIYGNIDLSIDDTTKGLQGFYQNGGSPQGRMGWLPAISTNLSYLGIRATHEIAPDLDVLLQLETQVDIAATAGTVNSGSNNDTVVKGALTSRNSYLGLGGKSWGALKIGKSDAPYKNSTARMNPFSGMIGDYSVVMGNSGGDNRVEFGTRLDHSIWYDSPSYEGVTFNLLYSPGQNRSPDNSNIAAGESSCAGGNAPGSGALPPSCNDGAFGTVVSASVGYQGGPLYLTAAYEVHKGVNRTSDTIGFPTTPAGDVQGDPNDIADETGTKVGVQYALPTGTTVSAIFEKLRRGVPAYLDYQNERTRNGTWLAITQMLSSKNSVSAGWAHAFPTPGDPGQHNTSGGANPDNAANMYTLMFRHMLDKQTSWYADWAMTANHPAAHYDLGAGGRAVTTDCHDASQLAAFDLANGGVVDSNSVGPHCFAGGRLQGVSIGMNYKF
jgi:predicted porin